MEMNSPNKKGGRPKRRFMNAAQDNMEVVGLLDEGAIDRGK